MAVKGRIKNQRLAFPPSKGRHSLAARQDRTRQACSAVRFGLHYFLQPSRPEGESCQQAIAENRERLEYIEKNHLAQEKLAFPTSEVCTSMATRIPAGHHQMGWNNFSIDTVRSGSLPLSVETQAPCQNGTTSMRSYASPSLRH